MPRKIALLLLTVAVGIVAGGCAQQPTTTSGSTSASPQAAIFSPEGVLDIVWIQEPTDAVRQAVGQPSKIEPSKSKTTGDYWTYATGDRAARVNIRNGVVFQVELLDISGGQSKVLRTKNAKTEAGK